MNSRSITVGAPIFIVAFLLQESIFNQIRLPASGFTFFLVFTFIWAALSTPEVGGVTGFGAGLLVDLSQAGGGPFGMWTLLLSIACYLVAFLGYGDDRIQANAFSVVILTVGAISIAQVSYIILGSFLGMETGTIFQILLTIVGTGLWNALLTPIIFPIVSWLHTLAVGGRVAL